MDRILGRVSKTKAGLRPRPVRQLHSQATVAEARRRWNVLEEVLSPEWLSAPVAAGLEEVGLAKQGLLGAGGMLQAPPPGP